MSWGFVYAVGPWQSSRHLMARDEHTVIRGAIYACFAVALMQILIYGIGGLINIANPCNFAVRNGNDLGSKKFVPRSGCSFTGWYYGGGAVLRIDIFVTGGL